jgi:hypothetical protein
MLNYFIKGLFLTIIYFYSGISKVIKRSQDIVNFLAFTNRISEKHLDIIWSSAQVNTFKKNVTSYLD